MNKKEKRSRRRKQLGFARQHGGRNERARAADMLATKWDGVKSDPAVDRFATGEAQQKVSGGLPTLGKRR